jgi:hypothetical protein
MEQRKFGLPIQKPTNARLYQCVPGKTKIKALMKLNTSTVNFMQMFGKRCHCVVNPANGAVEGILDMSGLKANQRTTERCFKRNCLQSKTKTIFVTGKTGIKCSK